MLLKLVRGHSFFLFLFVQKPGKQLLLLPPLVPTVLVSSQPAGWLSIKKLLERIKVCIESIMMKFPRELCTQYGYTSHKYVHRMLG